MNIKSMGLAWITVSNLAASKSFFKDILGLTIGQDSSDHGWMEFVAEDKSFKLGVSATDDSMPMIKPGQNAVVTFTIPCIMEAKAELQKHHVMLLGDIIEIPGHIKMLMFADADKNIFQVVEHLD